MSTAVLTSRLDLSSVADSTLKAATRFWFAVTVIGQFLFAFAVASFYGMTAARGDLHKWGKSISHGYVPGDTMGSRSARIRGEVHPPPIRRPLRPWDAVE